MNKRIYISRGNKILEKGKIKMPSGKYENCQFRIFNLPAISYDQVEVIKDGKTLLKTNKSMQSRNICVNATRSCINICYAKKRQETYVEGSYGSRIRNYRASDEGDFVNKMIGKITRSLNHIDNSGFTTYFRIHESGDFYSEEYLEKWVEITDKFKGVDNIKFIAYTKSIKILKNTLMTTKKS